MMVNGSSLEARDFSHSQTPRSLSQTPFLMILTDRGSVFAQKDCEGSQRSLLNEVELLGVCEIRTTM